MRNLDYGVLFAALLLLLSFLLAAYALVGMERDR
jgi:hypothetical protein